MAGRPAHRAITGVLLTTAALVATGLSGPQATAAEVRPTPSSGSWTVDGHGNGHGHGLSQYGARGAAIAGLSYDKILAFYYPGTTLTTAAAQNITVQVSDAGAAPTVRAEAGLTLTGIAGTLPTAGIDQWRLVPISGGFQVQRHLSTGWGVYQNLPASKLDFRAADGTIVLVRTSGARSYRGVMSAVETGSTAIAVNTLSLDDYVRGVVPSEMPASWQAAAVQAQAVAARSYARYAIDHPRSASYDICDTTSCQVYGGLSSEVAASNDAVTKTSNRVLTYAGATIFAEFSASNGGMTSSGGEPYFVTKPDPYDNAASGDPYLNFTETVQAADVADYYGLRTVTAVQITGREGGSQWGGLVSTGIVNGTDSSGAATAINVTGADLAQAMGLPYRYFFIRPVLPLGHLESASSTALHTLSLTGWAFDQTDGSKSDSVVVLVDGVQRASAVANLARPDVRQAYHLSSAAHGFSVAVSLPGGNHQVCAYALTLAGTDRLALGCTSVAVPTSPLGHVDTLVNDGKGHLQVSGWTFDPDSNGGPGRVHVYVDGYGIAANAAAVRSDVQRAFGLANNTVGFTVPVWIPAGTHRVCAYGINTAGTAGANQTLLCTTISR